MQHSEWFALFSVYNAKGRYNYTFVHISNNNIFQKENVFVKLDSKM